jgi:mRNA interferase MazF
LVWLEFTPHSGHEQSGRRPAIVLSPRSYNSASSLALLCPITSKVKGHPFEVELPGGAPVKGAVLTDQVKSVDWRARFAKFIGHAPKSVISDVQAKVRALID